MYEYINTCDHSTTAVNFNTDTDKNESQLLTLQANSEANAKDVFELLDADLRRRATREHGLSSLLDDNSGLNRLPLTVVDQDKPEG